MRLSSSSLVIASASTSCSERSAKRFTGIVLFRTTINNETEQTMCKRNRRPRRGAVRRQAWEGGLSPANSRVRNRGQGGRDIGVAQVDGRAPMESPLALEEIDEKGKHGGHRMRLLCAAQIGPSRVPSNRNQV